MDDVSACSSASSSDGGTSSSGAETPAPDYQRCIRWTSATFNVLCGFTMGYDLSVVSVLLNRIVADMALCGGDSIEEAREASCSRKQAVMSMHAAGAMCGRLFLTWVADKFGRRAALMTVDVIIVVSLAVQSLASNSDVFLTGRFLMGLGLGCSFVVGPVYLCEIAPPSRRGMFTTLNEVAVCAGYLMGLQVTTVLKLDHVSWRLALVLSGVPVLLQFLFLPFLPESPRWLAIQGNAAGFEQSAHALGLTQSEIDGLRFQVKQEAARSAIEGGRGLKKMLYAQRKAWRCHARTFFVVFSYNIFVTGSSIYAMQAYTLDILRHIGVTEPAKWQPFVGWMKLGGALVAVTGADMSCMGRRRLSTTGAAACCLCQLVIAMRFANIGALPVVGSALAFLLFIFAWNAGYGGLQMLVSAELLPNEVRSIWQGQILFMTGILEFLIYQWFLNLLQASGVVAFLLFGFINLFAATFAALCLPEVMGQSLEEAST